MLGVFSKNTTFFDDFESMAASAVAAATELVELSKEWPAGRERVMTIRKLEHQADEVAHASLQRLDRTFQTPISREDIHELIQTLDSIIDTIKHTTDRFEVFHVVSGNAAFTRQVETLLAATSIVEQAMQILHKDRRLPSLLDRIIAIHEQENLANDIQEAVMSDLFSRPCDALELMRWKELHELAVEATDQCEDVANIVERIAIQNA